MRFFYWVQHWLHAKWKPAIHAQACSLCVDPFTHEVVVKVRRGDRV